MENSAKHPGGSTVLLYFPRENGGRNLHAVETDYEVTKVKAAVRLYENKDIQLRPGQMNPTSSNIVESKIVGRCFTVLNEVAKRR